MKYSRPAVSSSGFSTGQSFNVASFMRNVEEMQGTFDGTVQWCSDLASENWKISHILVTEQGSLECQSDSKTRTTVSENSGNAIEIPRIDHLQGCKIHLIDKNNNNVPIVQVITKSQTDYFLAKDNASFEGLLYSLIWWSSLNSKGIFNKISLRPAPVVESSDGEAANLLVSQLVVYGPLPTRRIPVIKQLSRPSFLRKSRTEEGWFPAMGVLKSDGKLDLLLQSDGSLLYSLDIRALLRSEIRLLDPSLQNDNMLFLGTISELRKELGLFKRQKFILGGPAVKNDPSIILKFPLSIDVEDWLVALKAFALAEYLSITGSHDSDRLRLSNRFKLSIVEGNFPGISKASHGGLPQLYVELSIWDRTWGRTAIVQGTDVPFWREEFVFDESVKINNLTIEVKQRSQNKKDDETVGFVRITQEMINDMSLDKETRLPVLDSKKTRFNIGTICIRIVSSLNFILPAVNFHRFESALNEVNLSQLVNSARSFSLGSDLAFEDIAGILLDVFQALHKEDDWFSALIDRELLELDGSITKNSLNNKTSTHIYGTLFRGNSILTRSMESYFYRVGKEYLDLSIGPILRSIIDYEGSCEVDPERIKENDPVKKKAVLDENRGRLLAMVESIWIAIYSTSNDIPMPIKNQMTTLRKKLEIICVDDGVTRILNCVSGMLFLRFFCPVILNPKLFDLVRSHPSEQSRRTVTLVSKVLLNLSNLSCFGNKEPYMKGMNCFIDDHRDELLDYIDKVTQKKLDFAPKKLKLTNSVIRPKLLMSEEILAELPINPHLIDRYLRETELSAALAICAINKREIGKLPHTISLGQISKNAPGIKVPIDGRRTEISNLEFIEKTTSNVEISDQKPSKHLEQNYETVVENNREVNADAQSEMMEQLERESVLLYHKVKHLKRLLADYEFPVRDSEKRQMYAQFLTDNTYFSKSKQILIDSQHQLGEVEGASRLFKRADAVNLLDNIVPRVSSHSSSSGSLSRSDSSFSVTRKLNRFKTQKVNNPDLRDSSDKESLHSNGSSIKRWFRR
ncbi:hypothetical protein HG536_0A04190 [Torulaspora globosa]|uniref:Ras-GAP domain-containing protein n=1 Tax=Torulaspora globosa TaxID=48254 RepID=A0A7G3ZAR5_9SACH|nr:uncharacterized protein HG536_0A04190 [Torulaspora globosa]QLL30601.1 hypothetical protein HG536_0A04190 [Torulaspora globosa]